MNSDKETHPASVLETGSVGKRDPENSDGSSVYSHSMIRSFGSVF